jgi:hypothetical protein
MSAVGTNKQLKATLLALATAGAPRPDPTTELGKALTAFTTKPNHNHNLAARINRKIRSGQMLKRTRGERALTELGQYYVIDTQRNTLVWSHANLEVSGREYGVQD